ncbi:MAG: tryptophan synthase subunit alpha [Candidatus Baltobacteraceae bacterium]|jgi:tryptophan synthase alpha chain
MPETLTTGGARLAEAFRRAKAAGRGVLIPYICAGDPDAATTALVLDGLGPAGADAIELGIPYGDPLADGPTIAAAAKRALDAGTTVDDALALARGAHERGAPPILLFTYINPIVQYGLERFAAALVAAGACGAIVPDVPLEETGEIRAAFAPLGLALPLLVAPTTPPARAAAIARSSEGFVYVVSRLGVTSAGREPDFSAIAARVAALRPLGGAPIAVGFGISSAGHVRQACELADGAIVGSALVDAYAGTRGVEAAERAQAFLRGLAAGTRSSS